MIKKALIRHITVTGFIVNKSSTLLHWHNKVKEWLPPGGHIETNEDPVEALNREIYEETGLKIDIIKTNKQTVNKPIHTWFKPQKYGQDHCKYDQNQ